METSRCLSFHSLILKNNEIRKDKVVKAEKK